MRHFGKWIVLLVIASAGGLARGEEWPKWLGPEGTGISKEKIADSWPAQGPRKLWSQKVGEGFSSVVGINGTVYFFGMPQSDDVLTAMDAETGTVKWAQAYPVTHKGDQPQGLHTQTHKPLPEATPTIDGDRIYTYGGGGDLYCRNLVDGKVIWKLNVLDETHGDILKWNEASSPLVTEKLVYVQGGNKAPVAVAVHKTTGKIAWMAEQGVGGYAAPILVTVQKVPQLIVFGGKKLFGLDPQTGKTIWSQPWVTSFDVNASTPVFHDGKLFITSSYGHGCAMYSLTATSAKQDWKGTQIASKYQPCIFDNGKLYGNSDGRLKCINWPDGKVIWSESDIPLGEGGSFVKSDDKLIALSQQGTLSLVHLAPDGAKVVSQVEVFHYDKVWSAPVIYHGKVYVKGKDELICFDVAAK